MNVKCCCIRWNTLDYYSVDTQTRTLVWKAKWCKIQEAKLSSRSTKFFIKVKRDFNQAHQNQVTFNGFSFKVTAYFNQAQQQKLTHSTNFNSTPREYCVKLKKWAFLSFKETFFSVFENHSTSILKHGTPECRNAGTPERRNTKTRNTKLLKPGTHEK